MDDVAAKLLRMASLVHDTGHTAMSHVSEAVVANLPEVKDLIEWTTEEYGTRKPPLPSEAIAAAFVRSPAFREFLAMPETGADFISDVDDASRRIAALIVSGKFEGGKEFLSLLLNGAFDADKLDYMPRDCFMTGVPCALDVKRLVEKIHCLQVLPERIPATYREWASPSENGRYRVLALSRAGARALDEVGITRSILFEKVYYHPKVRALEVMVRRLLGQLRVEGRLNTLSEWLELTDEGLLSVDNPIAGQLTERCLLKRAFLITPPEIGSDEGITGATGTDSEWEGSAKSRGTGRQWRKLRFDYQSGELSRKVAALAVDIARQLELEEFPSNLPIEVDFPNLTKTGLDQFAFVGDGLDDLTLADAALSGERPNSAKRIARVRGHVFAPEEAILPVFLATRLVLLRDYEQEYDAACYSTTRLDLEDIDRAENRLAECGFLERVNSSRPLKTLPPARLRSHRQTALENFLKAAWPRIEQQSIVFGRYQSLGSTPVSPIQIADFLRQFEDESRARVALRVLDAIDFKDRQFFADMLARSLGEALKHQPVDYVCPLGSTGDSSSLLYYLMNDLPMTMRRPVLPLELALECEPLRHLLLWDDFCGAGGHTITALSQWLGLNDEGILDENLVHPLTSARKERLDQVLVSITFGLAMDRGLSEIRRFLRQHRIRALRVLDPGESLSAQAGIFSRESTFKSEMERDDFRNFLQEKAREFLGPKLSRAERPWTHTKLEDRLLGYGNAGHVIIFYYNVPTVSLTCLWETGENWQPLFPRRRKPSA